MEPPAHLSRQRRDLPVAMLSARWTGSTVHNGLVLLKTYADAFSSLKPYMITYTEILTLINKQFVATFIFLRISITRHVFFWVSVNLLHTIEYMITAICSRAIRTSTRSFYSFNPYGNFYSFTCCSSRHSSWVCFIDENQLNTQKKFLNCFAMLSSRQDKFWNINLSWNQCLYISAQVFLKQNKRFIDLRQTYTNCFN
jgi:hypothetical protein